MWLEDFPAAGGNAPVWHVAHCPATVTLLWNLAGAQALKPPLWHESQFALDAPDTFWYGMWLAGRPSAGGNEPLWQVEHWLATVACVWLNLVGFHPDTAWQLKQVLDAGMWALALPLAERPLWQLAQSVDALNPAWSTLAGVQRSFEWQLAQLSVVAM